MNKLKLIIVFWNLTYAKSVFAHFYCFFWKRKIFNEIFYELAKITL
jgi:hypothetical protein